MSQIVTAVTNSSGQVVKAQAYWAKPGAAPSRLVVQAGQKVVLQVDGQTQAGSALILGKRPVLRKAGKDLAIEVDGQPVVLLVDFFVVKGASLYGNEWALTPNQGLAMDARGVSAGTALDVAAVGVSGTGTGNKDLAAVGINGTGTGHKDLAAVGVSGTTRDVAAVGISGTTRDVAAVGVSGTTRDVAAVGVSGTTRDVAAVGVSGTTRDVAAVGVSGTTRDVAAVGVSGTNMEVAAVGLSGTKLAALAAGISLLPILSAMGKDGGEGGGSDSSSLSGSVVAGPVTGGLRVQVYKVENGSLVLLGVADVGAGGKWSLSFKGYTGPVVVRVLDINDSAGNYRSELTGQDVDLDVSLLAMVNVKQGSNALNITPVTTIAAIKAGVTVDPSGEVVKTLPSDFNAAKVDQVNLAVAKVLSLPNLVTGEVLTTVDINGGNSFDQANPYGKLLAAIEGAGGNNQETLEAIAALLDLTGQTAVMSLAGMQELVAGASAVEMERSQQGLTGAVSGMVTSSVSDANLNLAILGSNNVITDANRGAIAWRVTAPKNVTSLVVSINGEPLDLSTNPAPTSDGNGNWIVNLDSQSWPYGAHELMVQAWVGDTVSMSAKQMVSVVDTTPPEPEPFVLKQYSGRDLGEIFQGDARNDLVQFLGQNTGDFTVDTGAGNDTIEVSRMTTGQIQLKLGDGDDHVKAAAMTVGLSVWDGAGADSIVLGAGNDTVYADATLGAGGDNFFGRQGRDHLSYAAFAEALSFNFWGKPASGGKSGSVRSGGTGLPDKDLFYGFESFVGGSGNDTFFVGEGAGVNGTSIQGGAGNDSLHYSSTTPIDRVLLISNSGGLQGGGVAGSVSVGSDTDFFDGIEAVTLGFGNNTFNVSTNTAVTLTGGVGNDSFNMSASTIGVLNGGAGADVFVVSASSNVTLNGGDGNDSFSVSSLSNSMLNGGLGNNAYTVSSSTNVTLNGAEGNDSYTLNNTAGGVLNGGAGDDVFVASASSNVTLNGSDGNDAFTLSNLINSELNGGIGNDAFTMSSGSSVTLNGGEGNDSYTVSGTAVAVLNGGAGDDAFTISSQNSVTVNGGAGNDATTLSARDKALNGAGLGVARISVHDWSADTLTLQGFWDADQVNAGNLASFVSLVTSGGVVNLQVDLDGNGSTYTMTNVADLTGHTNFSSLVTLLESGRLIIAA